MYCHFPLPILAFYHLYKSQSHNHNHNRHHRQQVSLALHLSHQCIYDKKNPHQKNVAHIIYVYALRFTNSPKRDFYRLLLSPFPLSERLTLHLHPSDNLLVHRPGNSRAQRLPAHPQRQPIEQSSDTTFLRDHDPRRTKHVSVPPRLELQSCLDGVKGVCDGGGEAGRQAGRE